MTDNEYPLGYDGKYHMTLHDWLTRHAISPQAAAELTAVLAAHDHAPLPVDPAALAGEARVQSLVRIEAASAGVLLTRNNVGAFQDPATGRWIRYGLANESKQQNQLVKSGDLIGFHKREIIDKDVGSTIAQFVSRECKREGWKPGNSARDQAQARFRDFINLNGGDAAIVSGPGSFNYQR